MLVKTELLQNEKIFEREKKHAVILLEGSLGIKNSLWRLDQEK